MEKHAHLANLITLAKADGIMHPMESHFIQGIAARMGINRMDFTRISQNPDRASKSVPFDEETMVRHFCELIVLSKVDFMGSPEEKKLLAKIGERMNISQEKVQKLEKHLSENKLPNDYTDPLESL